MRSDDVGAGRRPIHEFIHFARRPVVDGDGEALIIHVQDQVLSHDRQADQADISLWFHLSLLKWDADERGRALIGLCKPCPLFIASKRALARNQLLST